ncbi:signal peptidase I [Actinoplanes sp. CA-252034]|uniref:signal peptidase I n=1 Tax=Actinoplanes sp. CA-252034 TaxID=3239906 RepID=UPI003D96A6B0
MSRSAVVVAAAGVLLVGGTVPARFGWSTSVVISGSMSPAVEAGDVVVTSPAAPARLRPGRVIRFHDPHRPGRYVLHRIVRVGGDGRLVTKGDANRVADVTPVPTGTVTGVWRLRVPYLGLPVLWWLEGRYPLLVVTALALLVPPWWWLSSRSRRSGRRPS